MNEKTSHFIIESQSRKRENAPWRNHDFWGKKSWEDIDKAADAVYKLVIAWKEEKRFRVVKVERTVVAEMEKPE